MAAAEANPLPPARPARQQLALPVGAMLKPPSSPKPRCLQATAPRIDGSGCLTRRGQDWAVRGGHASGPTPAQLLGGLWSLTSPGGWGPMLWPCRTCSPQAQPSSTPEEQGHPSGAATLARGPGASAACLGASPASAGVKLEAAGAVIWG